MSERDDLMDVIRESFAVAFESGLIFGDSMEEALTDAILGAGFGKVGVAEPFLAPRTAWGTDCWGEVQSEPSEEHARKVAEKSGANVYHRAPMGAWIKEES